MARIFKECSRYTEQFKVVHNYFQIWPGGISDSWQWCSNHQAITWQTEATKHQHWSLYR